MENVRFFIFTLSEREFALLKVIADKGALALGAAFFAFILAILLEQHKSLLARRNEVSKLLSSHISNVSEACDVLYATGCREITVREV